MAISLVIGLRFKIFFLFQWQSSGTLMLQNLLLFMIWIQATSREGDVESVDESNRKKKKKQFIMLWGSFAIVEKGSSRERRGRSRQSW
jgi:hypothetical protein